MEKLTRDESFAAIDTAVDEFINEKTDRSALVDALRSVHRSYRNERQGESLRRAVSVSIEKMDETISAFNAANESVSQKRVRPGISDDAVYAIRATVSDTFTEAFSELVDNIDDPDEKEFASRILANMADAVDGTPARPRKDREKKKGISDMLTDGTLRAGQHVTLKGVADARATVTKDGMLSVNGEKMAVSPAAAHFGVTGVNGMVYWCVGEKTLRQIAGD